MQTVFRQGNKKKNSSNIKNSKANLFQKIPFLKLVYSSIIVNLVVIILVLVLKNRIPPEVPLFYGLADGEDQLTKNVWLIIDPAVSLTVVLINVYLVSLVTNDLLKKTLIITGFCVTIFSLVTLVQIVLLVGYF